MLPDGTNYSVLYDFAAGANGKNPWGDLIKVGSVLYGLTESGGDYDRGVIFGYDLSPLGLKENNIVDDFEITPNPSSGKFIVSSNNLITQDGLVVVKNILGELIFQSEINNQKLDLTFDLSTKPRGIYFITFRDKSRNITKKVIID
jgi:hypothetical protein